MSTERRTTPRVKRDRSGPKLPKPQFVRNVCDQLSALLAGAFSKEARELAARVCSAPSFKVRLISGRSDCDSLTFKVRMEHPETGRVSHHLVRVTPAFGYRRFKMQVKGSVRDDADEIVAVEMRDLLRERYE